MVIIGFYKWFMKEFTKLGFLELCGMSEPIRVKSNYKTLRFSENKRIDDFKYSTTIFNYFKHLLKDLLWRRINVSFTNLVDTSK